jgi:hypothetical protein
MAENPAHSWTTVMYPLTNSPAAGMYAITSQHPPRLSRQVRITCDCAKARAAKIIQNEFGRMKPILGLIFYFLL